MEEEFPVKDDFKNLTSWFVFILVKVSSESDLTSIYITIFLAILLAIQKQIEINKIFLKKTIICNSHISNEITSFISKRAEGPQIS